MRSIKTAVLAAAAAAALGVSACGGDEGGDRASGAAASGAKVEVKAFQFGPDPLEVERGTTVTWSNADQTRHTVTSGTRERPGGELDGDLAAAGAAYAHRFDRAGTFRYVCTLHSGPGMEATVIVR